MTNDGPPRHLHPVEPPFDDRYDAPPPDTGRTPPQDLAAEQAILTTLLHYPELGDRIATELEPADFWRPVHETIWTAWHHLAAAEGVPPDAITFNAHLVAHQQSDAARTVVDLLTSTATPTHIDDYIRIVRDNARLRVVADLARGLQQLANTSRADQVDVFLGEALQRLDETVMRFGPRTPTGSGFRDLSWLLTGQAPEIPPPAWVHHDAGHAIFYDGKVNGVFGDPETAKTWLAQCAIVEALNSDTGTAAMIDVDHNGENHTAARLLLLGARPDTIADPNRFRYYDPQEGAELRAAVDDITAHRSNVVLIDSLGEVFPMLGLNSNDGDEITGGLRLISRPADVGSCVIFIDHLPKSVEARASGFAIGSIAKKRAVRGSYIRAEERTKPAPGQVGKISLFIEKDTAGELRRAVPGGKYLGTFILDSREPHITRWSVVRDDAPTGPGGQKRYTQVMERISRFVEDNDQCTSNDIKASVGGNATVVGRAIKVLIDEGFISVHTGARRAQLHHSISLYREAEDDNAQPDD